MASSSPTDAAVLLATASEELAGVDPSTSAPVGFSSSKFMAPGGARLLASSHSEYARLASALESISADSQSELRDELKAKKVDVGAVRDLLRFHAARQIELATKLEEIAQAEQDAASSDASEATAPEPYALPSSLLLAHPLLPPPLRAQVWLLLLGCHNKDTTLLDGFDPEKITRAAASGDLTDSDDEREADERTATITPSLRENIHIDARRTRGGMQGNDALVGELELLLLYYCHARSLSYRQGLNEILGPILLTMSPPSTLVPMSRGSVFNAFYALISKYLPGIFNDLDLENLRALFRLFRLMIVYHDPHLAAHLEEAGIQPELYATHWFLTLFAAGGCDSLSTLQRLWDSVLIEDDPFFHYFIGLALLRRHRAFLLSTATGKDLPIVLRGLVIRSEDLLGLLHEAKRLRAATPTSLRQTLFEISFAKRDQLVKTLGGPTTLATLSSTQSALASAAASGTFVPSSAVSTHLLEQFSAYSELLPCMTVPAAEIVQQAYSDLSGEGQIKFIVLDVRSAAEFAAGHLPCAIHISPSVLHIPSQLEALVSKKQYGGMRECHFCFVGSEAASFASVQTPAGGGASASSSSSSSHSLLLPTHRRPVAPPSPASSLAALAESARGDAGREALAALQLASIPIRDVTEDAGGSTPIFGGASGESGENQMMPLTVGSPMSRQESASGVLYRPNQDPSSSPPPSSAGLSSPNSDGGHTHARGVTSSTIVTSPLLDSALASFVHFFLSRGFAHLSVCEGGFPAVHQLVKAQAEAFRAQKAAIAAGELHLSSFQTPLENMELVDHDAKVCAVCNAPPTTGTAGDLPTSETTNGMSEHTTSTPPATGAPKKDDGKKTANTDAPLASGVADAASSSSTGGTSSKGAAPPTATPVASTAAGVPASGGSSSDPAKPSALSKFSLGFKKFTSGVGEKLEKYKQEKAAADAIKAAEKEKADALKAAENAIKAAEKEKADALKAILDAEKEREKKEQAEKAAAEKAERERVKELEKKEREEKLAAEKAEKERLKEEEREKAEKEKASASSSDSTASDASSSSKETGLGSRFLSALGIDKQRYFSQKYSRSKLAADSSSSAPVSEVNAAIDLNDWSADKENIALFHCHEISLLPVGSTPVASATPAVVATPAAPSESDTPTAPAPAPPRKSKRTGVLLPRVLAITAGYVITFQPAKPPGKTPSLAATASGAGSPTSSSSGEDSPFGLAFLKQKYRLIDLDKITSKRDRPSILTFHWKAKAIDAAADAMDRPAPPTLPPSQATSPMARPSRQISAVNPDEPPATPSSSFLPHDRDFSGAASPGETTSTGGRAAAPVVRGPTTMFLVERPQECIALVRAKFLLAKASAALAESNKREPSAEEEAQLKAELAAQAREMKHHADEEPEDADEPTTQATTTTAASTPWTGDAASTDDAFGAIESELLAECAAGPLSVSVPREHATSDFITSPMSGGALSPDSALEDLLDL